MRELDYYKFGAKGLDKARAIMNNSTHRRNLIQVDRFLVISPSFSRIINSYLKSKLRAYDPNPMHQYRSILYDNELEGAWKLL